METANPTVYQFNINDWMPLLVGIILTILAYYQTRKQSSREFVARERAEWLKETRNRYTSLLELISKIFNLVQNHKNDTEAQKDVTNEKVDEIYSQIYEHSTYLSMMFNPKDEEILKCIEDSIKLTKKFVEASTLEKKNEVKVEISRNINKMNFEMRNYFKTEWDQIKVDISYKKKFLQRFYNKK